MLFRVFALCHLATLAGAYGCSGDHGQAPPSALPGVAERVPLDRHILVDQFGYLPDEVKVAVIRDPQWGYDKNLKDAPYDIDKAKALLKEAGYPDGFDLTLWAMPVQRPYNPNARLMAEMLQADWAKIGVRTTIATYEWGEYIRRAHAGEHEAILIGWTGDYGDPDNWLGVLLGCEAVKGSNFSKWCYKPFDDLIRKARGTTDLSERTKDYVEAQEIFKQQVPFTPIAHSTVYQPISKDVTGFKIDPFGPTQFMGVGLK